MYLLASTQNFAMRLLLSRWTDTHRLQNWTLMLEMDSPPVLPLPGASGEPLKPLPSLWRMVAEHVTPSERLEVKTILGVDAVERSLELHAEVQTLLEFYQELQADYPRVEQNSLQALDSLALLAAPPHRKELVREEIRLLLIGLQQKALQEGRDQDCAIAKYSPHVVTFALKTNAGSGRPPSRSSAFIGKDLEIDLPVERPLSSRATNELEPFCNKLSIAHIGEVAARLQTMLQDECLALERYISHLQRQVEEAHRCATQLPNTTYEPTMAELQEEKRAMERDLQQSQHESCLSPSLMPKQLGSSSYQPSRPKGSAKGPNFGKTIPTLNAASSPNPRGQSSPLSHQNLHWWDHSARGPLKWLQQGSEESNLTGWRKDNDHRLPRAVIPMPPKGVRIVSGGRTAIPAFHPMPPPEPCSVPRFCPRTRLLRCKGPS